MNPDLLRLTPGITAIFLPLGYTVNVTELNDQLSISLTKDGVTFVQQFPYPSTNRDLSIPLQTWKVQLQGG